MFYDIYFDKNYGKLYEKLENGICEVFEYKSEYGEINHIFIKRKIQMEVDNITYYDLITPYGYGGPIIKSCEINSKKKLIYGFFSKFEEYCINNNIVSEFVRFYPLSNNALDFRDIYDIVHDRKTVGTNLKYDNPIDAEFSKSCKKKIKKILKNDIRYEITKNPNEISDFIDIYYSTMDRNNAKDYYYFDREYFQNCIKYFSDNIVIVKIFFEKKVIAMGLYFISDNIIHIHLSGTLSEYLSFSPAYILRYAIVKWGKENGYSLVHHGGGKTNKIDDSLYLFKKNFGVNTEFDFYVAKKIWNCEIYKKLCLLSNNSTDVDFFPAYRYKK